MLTLRFGFLAGLQLLGPRTITANLCPFFASPPLKRRGSTTGNRLKPPVFCVN